MRKIRQIFSFFRHKKKVRALGFRYTDKGKIAFDFTDEEQARIEETMRAFQDYIVRTEYADEFQKMLICLSLVNLGNEYWNQASPMRTEHEARAIKQEIDRLLHKAIAAYTKAFSIYSMKPILVLMAVAFIAMGNSLEAKACLERYISYVRLAEHSDRVTNLFLEHFLKTFNYNSVEEMDAEVKRLISTL